MAEEATLQLGVDQPMAAAAAAAAEWEPWRGDLLQIPGKFPREEVEAAFHEYLRRANANDWDAWCDLFTDDVHYVDHYFGVMHGLDAVRAWMVPLMAGQPEMKFPPGWHVIAGDVIVNYNWNRWPNPDGSFEPYNDPNSGIANINYKYQFPCVTLNRYAGDGLFWYEEDLYSPSAYIEIITQWKADMDRHGRKYGQ